MDHETRQCADICNGAVVVGFLEWSSGCKESDTKVEPIIEKVEKRNRAEVVAPLQIINQDDAGVLSYGVKSFATVEESCSVSMK